MRNGKKEMADTTDYNAKCEILADVWMEYRDEDAFKELFDFADLGFPLAYAVANGIIESNEAIADLVNGTFDLLLKLLKVEDTGFDNINQLFDTADGKNNS
jgi:hypothetical protein